MARRGNPSGPGNRSAPRAGGWFTLTGCFIGGIFVCAVIFLYSLHYTVQVSSYFQQNSKLRREDFHLPNFHILEKVSPLLSELSGMPASLGSDDAGDPADPVDSIDNYIPSHVNNLQEDSSIEIKIEPAVRKDSDHQGEDNGYGYEEIDLAEEAKNNKEDGNDNYSYDDDNADADIDVNGADDDDQTFGYGYFDDNDDSENDKNGAADDGADDDQDNKYGYIDDEEKEYEEENGEARDDGGDDDTDDSTSKNNSKNNDNIEENDVYGYELVEQEDLQVGEQVPRGHREPHNNEGEGYGYFEDDKQDEPGPSVAVKPSKLLEQNVKSDRKPTHAEKKPPSSPNVKNKKGKKRDPYNYVVQIDPDWGLAGKWDLKYIQVLPTAKKPMIKKDRRVIFPNFTRHVDLVGKRDPPSGIPGMPRELIKANEVLDRHPLNQRTGFDKQDHTLVEVMHRIKNSPMCAQQPVYLTMATVGDELYWQLIENFVYSLVKFEVSECSLVICVSDVRCMKMCDAAKFPCYNYVSSDNPLPSVMEQIAQVKLLHVPKALSMGVDVFMLDLDVGFLESPRHLVQAFVETPIVDIFVQEDYIFIMNRTKAGWGQYFTEPLPNIGLFLCRGNNRTARVFELAWGKYLNMKDPIEKSQPGKDQNHVLDSMRIGRGTFGLKYAYFSTETAPLLDKLVLREGNTMELGGDAIQGYLDEKRSIAMHTTCYEKSTKVMGLKAANAFWNPKYYDPLRRTITKQLIYINDEQLLDELRSLVWLALSTDRALIIPNILGSEEKGNTFKAYQNQVMWPGFRVTFLKRSKGRNDLNVQILEPAYYWRIQRDYDPIPDPSIVYFQDGDNLMRIKENMDKVDASPRIIIQAEQRVRLEGEARRQSETELKTWADDSVGIFPRPYAHIYRQYHAIPSVKGIRAVRGIRLVQDVLQNMRNCKNIFGSVMGTRSCFQICD